MTLALVAILVLGTTALVRQLQDPTPANLELGALAWRVDGTTTREQLLRLVGTYSRLHTRTEERSVIVLTPNRPSADNWVAWFRFRPDGTIVKAYTGTVDYAPASPKPPGMPEDRCFGSRTECLLP